MCQGPAVQERRPARARTRCRKALASKGTGLGCGSKARDPLRRGTGQPGPGPAAGKHWPARTRPGMLQQGQGLRPTARRNRPARARSHCRKPLASKGTDGPGVWQHWPAKARTRCRKALATRARAWGVAAKPGTHCTEALASQRADPLQKAIGQQRRGPGMLQQGQRPTVQRQWPTRARTRCKRTGQLRHGPGVWQHGQGPPLHRGTDKPARGPLHEGTGRQGHGPGVWQQGQGPTALAS